jgi:hypothetical protein
VSSALRWRVDGQNHAPAPGRNLAADKEESHKSPIQDCDIQPDKDMLVIFSA